MVKGPYQGLVNYTRPKGGGRDRYLVYGFTFDPSYSPESFQGGTAPQSRATFLVVRSAKGFV